MFESLIACPVAAGSSSLTGLICQATLVVLELVPVLLTLAFIYFLWGISQWILNMNNEEKIKEGRERMIWGIVALFFILSMGGILALLMNTFFSGGGSGSRSSGSLYPSGYSSGGGGVQAVQAPINSGGSGGGTQTLGFFRTVWCQIGFINCSSGGSGGSGTIHTGGSDPLQGGSGGVELNVQFTR